MRRRAKCSTYFEKEVGVPDGGCLQKEGGEGVPPHPIKISDVWESLENSVVICTD